MKRNQAIVLLLAAATLTAALISCGSDDAGTTDTQGAVTGTETNASNRSRKRGSHHR